MSTEVIFGVYNFVAKFYFTINKALKFTFKALKGVHIYAGKSCTIYCIYCKSLNTLLLCAELTAICASVNDEKVRDWTA